MAYGTKYHYQITDYKGITTLVRLKLRDYTGVDTALDKGGVTFEFGQDRAATVVRGSSAKIGLWSLTQGQFVEFRSITDRKWMVEVLKGGVLYWCGWLTPEIYSEPFKHSLPYRIEISAVDGLGDLSNIDFVDTSGQFVYVARASFKSVINQCLNSTGFALNVCYSAALRPTGTTGDVFESCYIALSSFLDNEYQPLKCDEVLERFFPLGITVKQWAGKWYVVRTEDLVAVSHIYEYTSAGVFVSQYDVSFNQTIDNNNTVGSQNLITGQSAIMSSGAAYKEAVVKIDYGKKPSLLNNFDFAIPGDSWLTTLSQYGFQYKETESETYGYLNPMDASGALTGIHQAFPVVATAKDFTLSFKVAPFGWHRVSVAVNTPRQPILLKIKIQVKLVGTTTYYLDKDQGWITTEAFIEITDLESTVVPGAAANWHEIKIITDALPISGNMDVWLYRLPYVSLPSNQVVLGVGYTAIRAYSDDDAYLSTMELKGVNDPDYNFIPGVKTMMLNDCPDEDNARRLYVNYVSNAAGVPTTTWEVDGVAGTYTLAELYLRQAIAMHVRPTNIINMTMRGVVAWPGTMSDGEGNRYEVVSAVLADRNCEWQLELREILPPEGASPVITSGARTTKSTNSSTRTVNANNDYRTYLNGIGSPKRINDLTHAAAVLDGHRFEVDKTASAESQYIEALELASYVATKYKLAYNAQLNRIEVGVDFSTPGILSALDGNSTNWNAAFGWGNHAGLYRLIGYVPSWAEVTSKPAWTDKMGWDGAAVTVSTDMHITGKLVVDGTIQFFGSGATGGGGGGSTTLWGLSDVSDDVANSVYGDLIMYDGTHFARINQSVLAPAVHTHTILQVNGLQGALDGKMAIHTHPYLSDADGRITNWNTGYTHSQAAHNKAFVGLGNVDNTADSTKSVSYATTSTSTTYWGGIQLYLGAAVTSIGYALAYDGTNARGGIATDAQFKTWLGLGSNAYSSTAYLPTSGGAVGFLTLTSGFNCTTTNSNFCNGDLSIGYASYQGYKFAVNGTGYFSNSLTSGGWIGSISNTVFAKGGGTAGNGYQLNATTIGYDTASATGWIQVGNSSGLAELKINPNGALVSFGGNATFGGSVTAGGTVSANNISVIKGGTGLMANFSCHSNYVGEGTEDYIQIGYSQVRLGQHFSYGTSYGWLGFGAGQGIKFDASGNLTATGNIIGLGTMQFYTASDRRLKTDFETIINPIAKIKALTGYFFNYNDEGMRLGGYEKRRDIGLIAQDVDAILPEACGTLWGTHYMGYKADKLIPLLVEAIKQQQTEIDQLKRQIAA